MPLVVGALTLCVHGYARSDAEQLFEDIFSDSDQAAEVDRCFRVARGHTMRQRQPWHETEVGAQRTLRYTAREDIGDVEVTEIQTLVRRDFRAGQSVFAPAFTIDSVAVSTQLNIHTRYSAFSGGGGEALIVKVGVK
eukprot:SAG11_NODE_6616_length_1279_cov_0.842373_3_plen_136_part_01